MSFDKSAWSEPGATLSDKSACKEYGLTKDEIIAAIRAGKLQYRQNSIYGSPYFKLIRSEIEALINAKHGGNYLQQQKVKAELAKVTTELRSRRRRITVLEQRKANLLASFDPEANGPTKP